MLKKIEKSIETEKMTTPFCLFAYSNYLKYGLKTEIFSIFKCNNYYFSVYNKTSLHLFEEQVSLSDLSKILNFAEKHFIKEIRGSLFNIEQLKILKGNCDVKIGKLFRMQENFSIFNSLDYEEATTEKDFKELSVMICSENRKYNNHFYSEESYYSEVYSRFKLGYTRTYIVRIDGKIIAACSTYAETPSYAVIGGLAVKSKYQRQHYGSNILKYLISKLQKENKKVFLFCFNPKVESFYRKLSDQEYFCGVLYLK